MSSKSFFIIVISLSILTILTSPPLVRPFLQQEPTPTPTSVVPTSTATPTFTPDPFANVPTATPQTEGIVIEINTLPSPALGDLPPTFTPTLVNSPTSNSTPDLTFADEATHQSIPAPTPAGMPPDRFRIPRLALDVPVTPVGMMPVPGPGRLADIPLPAGTVAGWLNSSAPFAQPGNTVLLGRHQLKGLTVFHELGTLERGDDLILYAGDQSRHYVVDEVFSDLDWSFSTQYIQPTDDERLTLVTGGPSTDDSQQTVVIAKPMMNEK